MQVASSSIAGCVFLGPLKFSYFSKFCPLYIRISYVLNDFFLKYLFKILNTTLTIYQQNSNTF